MKFGLTLFVWLFPDIFIQGILFYNHYAIFTHINVLLNLILKIVFIPLKLFLSCRGLGHLNFHEKEDNKKAIKILQCYIVSKTLVLKSCAHDSNLCGGRFHKVCQKSLIIRFFQNHIRISNSYSNIIYCYSSLFLDEIYL